VEQIRGFLLDQKISLKKKLESAKSTHLKIYIKNELREERDCER
jgi:hypothetical protein